jgi:hypothetical protein
VYDVAEVVYNYSQAGIPLETMWTDIDYMESRRVFSLDPERFSLDMMQGLVDHLHANDQHYVMMGKFIATPPREDGHQKLRAKHGLCSASCCDRTFRGRSPQSSAPLEPV